MSKTLRDLGLPHVYVKGCGSPTLQRGNYHTVQNLGFPEVTEDEWLAMYDAATSPSARPTGRLLPQRKAGNTRQPVSVTPEMLQQIWATLPECDDEFERYDDGS